MIGAATEGSVSGSSTGCSVGVVSEIRQLLCDL